MTSPPLRTSASPASITKNSYRELESDGVVTTHGRHGTVVARPPRRATPPPELLDAARRYANQASREGATLDDALTAVRVAFAAVPST